MARSQYTEVCALRSNLLQLDQVVLEYGAVETSFQSQSTKHAVIADLNKDGITQWANIKEELAYLIRSAAPVAISSISGPLTMLCMLSAATQLGAVALASINLANLFAGICGTAPLAGVAMALDTYCSQSFTAAGDKRILGVLLQRAMIMGVLITSLIYPLWWNSRYVFEVFDIPQDVADMAGQLLRVYFFGTVLVMAYELLRSFLFAQGVRNFVLVAQPAGVAVAWTITSILLLDPSTSVGVMGTPFVILGAGLAYCIVTVAFIATVRGHQCWGGWSQAALHDWKPLAKLSAASTVAKLLGMFPMHIVSFGSVLMGKQAMAVHAVLATLLALPLGLGSAIAIIACNRVGNNLGLSLANRVQLTVLATSIFSVVVFVPMALVLHVFQSVLPSLFTGDSNVGDMVTAYIPLMAVAGAILGINTALNGVLRGQGKQGIIVRVRFFALVLFGIPVSALSTLVFNLELAGLWLGYSAYLAAILSVQICLIRTTDWDREITKCQNRIAAIADRSHRADRAIGSGEGGRILP